MSFSYPRRRARDVLVVYIYLSSFRKAASLLLSRVTRPLLRQLLQNHGTACRRIVRLSGGSNPKTSGPRAVLGIWRTRACAKVEKRLVGDGDSIEDRLLNGVGSRIGTCAPSAATIWYAHSIIRASLPLLRLGIHHPWHGFDGDLPPAASRHVGSLDWASLGYGDTGPILHQRLGPPADATRYPRLAAKLHLNGK